MVVALAATWLAPPHHAGRVQCAGGARGGADFAAVTVVTVVTEHSRCMRLPTYSARKPGGVRPGAFVRGHPQRDIGRVLCVVAAAACTHGLWVVNCHCRTAQRTAHERCQPGRHLVRPTQARQFAEAGVEGTKLQSRLLTSGLRRFLTSVHTYFAGIFIALLPARTGAITPTTRRRDMGISTLINNHRSFVGRAQSGCVAALHRAGAFRESWRAAYGLVRDVPESSRKAKRRPWGRRLPIR